MAKRKPKATATEAFSLVLALAKRDNLADYQVANYARKLTELPNRERVVKRSLKELVEHERPSCRRIGITVCRSIGRFDVPGLREALLRRLADTDPWVQREAVLAIHKAGYDGSDVREILENLVGDRDTLEKAESGLWIKSDLYGQVTVACNEENVGLWTRVWSRKILDALIENQAESSTFTNPPGM